MPIETVRAIRRHPNGSIDLEFYEKQCRIERSRWFYARLGQIKKRLHLFLISLGPAPKRNKTPAQQTLRYAAKTLGQPFDARTAAISKFTKGKLDSERAQQLTGAMKKTGLPV